MELLESYLKAVRRYLPRRQRDDIIAELSEELRLQMEARETQLGRALSETERMAILKDHGDPMVVARRYRQNERSLTIGWELIGPELFPLYLIFLGLNLTLALGFTVAIFLYLHKTPEVGALVRTGVIQVAVVTVTFTILNLIRRVRPDSWYYPSAELATMLPIPRWVSISGLYVWSVFSLWWAAVPFFPALLFGSAAGTLQLSPAWHRFYVPILILLLAGIAQRVINLWRPNWNALLPTSRLLINAVALGLQYPMIKSYPYVIVASAAQDAAHMQQVAAAFNGGILWGVLSWVWLYHLICVVVYAWYCVPHLRRLLLRKHGGIRLTQEINGIQ